MRKLRIGISPCPNDVWVFGGLLSGAVAPGADAVFEDVQTLNERAGGANDLDLVKISYAAWPDWRESHVLLRCGGALGRGCGPLLLRNGAGDYDGAAPVWIPGERTTAAFLLRHWLGGSPVDPRPAPFDRLYRHLVETPGAQGVVIHEKRFTYARDGLTLVADLGEVWERSTGCPIPLGAIVAPQGSDVEAMESIVRASLEWSESNPEAALDACRRLADEMDDDVMRAHIGLYVNEWTRDLGEDGGRAVETFLARLEA
ncbi:MAG: MqnA/MqnD/SBP family protein [Armatimonadota bacterium]